MLRRMRGRERGRMGIRKEIVLEIGACTGDERAMVNVQNVECGMTRMFHDGVLACSDGAAGIKKKGQLLLFPNLNILLSPLTALLLLLLATLKI